tara:strand:- start:572 stop:778 length:207 start_codon:yes stop_codon:yes gene_type:complete
MSTTKPNMKTQKEFDSYIVRDDSPINFGKLRGKPHSVLLYPENSKYREWILGLEDFAVPTKRYLIENM